MSLTKIESSPSTKGRLLLGGISLFFISGAITAFGQPDRWFFLPLLSYCIGYLSIFFLLQYCQTKMVRIILAFTWMFGVQLVQLDWLATTTYHGNAILLVYFLLAAGISLQFAILSLFFSKRKPLRLVRCLAIASLWTLFEISRLYYLCGFPFNPTGLPMTFHPALFQIVSLFGVYGLSFWIIFTAAFGASSLFQRSWKKGIVWSLLLLLPLAYGMVQLELYDKASAGQKKIDVALVQTGLDVEQKWNFPDSEGSYIEPFDQWKNIYEHLQSTGKDHFDLIVLPEIALPGGAFTFRLDYREVMDKLFLNHERLPSLLAPYAELGALDRWEVSHAWMAQAIANQFKSEFIIGLNDHDSIKQESYNSAFHFIPFRTSVNRYEKRVLVPLAEYLPLSIMTSFLEKYGITTFFTPGKKAKVFSGQIPLAISICYEEGYCHLIRESKLLGAELLVNVSNDGWFPKSRLPQEHFNLGRLRAVENGVPVVRACNTGVTAAIDSAGRIQGQLKDLDSRGKNCAGVVVTSLGTYHYTTLFSLFGNHLLLLICTIFLLGFFLYKKVLQL